MKLALNAAALLAATLYAFPALAEDLESDESKLARCTENDRDPGEDDLGKLLCQNTAGLYAGVLDPPYSCEECFGLNGYDAIKTSDINLCTIIREESDGTINPMKEYTACPGDDVPEEDPDGNPSKDIAEGILDTWCAVAGTGGLFGFPNMLACYGWAFSKNGDVLEQNKIGQTLVCDTLFFGMCTALTELN